MLTATKPSVMLSDQDLADEQGIAWIEALRQIAKGLIPATSIPNQEGPPTQRVAPAALQAYMAKGAPDCRLPDYSPGADWYIDSAYRFAAGSFESAMTAAIEEQVPAQEKIQAAYNRSPGSRPMFDAVNTGAVAALLEKPVPGSMVGGPTGADNSRFNSWWQPYLVSKMRDAAATIVRSQPGGYIRPPFETLFAFGPTGFDAIANAAYAQVSQRYIATTVQVKVNTKPGLSPYIPITMRWPLKSLPVMQSMAIAMSF